jgi:hypothetical protein
VYSFRNDSNETPILPKKSSHTTPHGKRAIVGLVDLLPLIAPLLELAFPQDSIDAASGYAIG